MGNYTMGIVWCFIERTVIRTQSFHYFQTAKHLLLIICVPIYIKLCFFDCCDQCIHAVLRKEQYTASSFPKNIAINRISHQEQFHLIVQNDTTNSDNSYPSFTSRTMILIHKLCTKELDQCIMTRIPLSMYIREIYFISCYLFNT